MPCSCWPMCVGGDCLGSELCADSSYTGMCDEGGGVEGYDNAAIINTASIAGKKGYPNMAAYCGSKFAAIGITQALAAELAPSNIRVNAICPGMVGTAMWLEHLLPSNAVDPREKATAFENAMHSTIPLGRPQTAEDMGQAALFLASATNVTGVSLSVAGGFEMN